ncbi:MAG: sensor histidine kinase KdpD [Anaerolineae bacterium]|nr:sensor histidine kinase KdpD [Anaerolineae bacterium]
MGETKDHRPDPDALLSAIQKEERKAQQGKLKIFFGMAAGVGKTYAMLESASGLLVDGVDIVVGYVETHGRAETEALLKGLEIIPRKQIEYRGTLIEEMDIDAILARKPTIVLVDELAHTNAPGSRHPKRYQDVRELLDAGINVYTTVNVQHVESRTDAVRQITGVEIRETVPDSIIENADEIELIDLAPEELLKRLAEGKVYTPDRAQLAIQKFFRKGNLTALREMSLRLTAERVDHQLQDYMEAKQIAGPWKSGERLMVAVSSSPLSERLVRWTRRMAYNLEAPWLAVHVETEKPLTATQKAQLNRNLSLARELGGEVIIISGSDLVATMLHVAHTRNVTQVVVGKPARGAVQELFSGGSAVNRLVRHSGEIDVYVVTGDESESSERPLNPVPVPQITSSAKQYLMAAGIVVIATMLGLLLLEIGISYQAIALILLFAILVLGLFLGRGPVLLAATLSAVMWNFLFIPPRFTYQISQLEDVLLFVMYFLIAIVTGNLTYRVRSQERAVRLRESRTDALYRLAHEIASTVTMEDVFRVAVEQIGQVFDADVAILLTQASGQLASEVHPASTYLLDEKERSVATWAFDNRKPAGRFTDTLPLAKGRYIPLITSGGVFGVMGVALRGKGILQPDQETLLETFVNQVSLVVERELLDEAAKRANVLEESERLYATLLNSISHELRTPLAVITGATTSMIDPNVSNDPEKRQVLIHNLQDAAVRLNRLVENLLDMTRLESGRMRLNLEWCDITDLINVSLSRAQKNLAEHRVDVKIASGLPLIRIDFVLMEQVLLNLLYNAAAYTPKGSKIEVSAHVEGKTMILLVEDNGPGLSSMDVERVFDKFYRGAGVAAGGTGLGLSIARGLVEAHGGTIRAGNKPEGGAMFTIRLPITDAPPVPKEAEL